MNNLYLCFWESRKYHILKGMGKGIMAAVATSVLSIYLYMSGCQFFISLPLRSCVCMYYIGLLPFVHSDVRTEHLSLKVDKAVQKKLSFCVSFLQVYIPKCQRYIISITVVLESSTGDSKDYRLGIAAQLTESLCKWKQK